MVPYRLSLTFGGLLIPETQVISDAYIRLGDWDAVRDEVVEQNLLRKTRQGSSRRYVREIRERLKTSYDWELPIIAGHEGGPDECLVVILAIAARHYRLVWEFLTEVIRHKVIGGDYRLLGFEFESFWERKAEEAPEARAGGVPDASGGRIPAGRERRGNCASDGSVWSPDAVRGRWGPGDANGISAL